VVGLSSSLLAFINMTQDSKGPSQYLLPKLSAELQAEGQALLLSSFHIGILTHACSSTVSKVLIHILPRMIPRLSSHRGA